MAATYTPIASITLGSNVSSVTFNSIPQTYTDLVLVIQPVAGASIYNSQFRFNGDSGSNYGGTVLTGNGSSAASYRGSNITAGYLDSEGYPSTTAGATTQIMHVMNYANTTTFKTTLNRSVRASSGTDLIVNTWRSTSAITSITLGSDLGAQRTTYVSGCILNLYGILGANA
jgi:hypothetical protein